MSQPSEPTRTEVDGMVGATVLEFTSCPICQRARPLIDEVRAEHAEVRHIRIEDGKGRPLGRSFRVKLWPTLVFLENGREITRVVRPTDEHELRMAFERVGRASTSDRGRL
jgi:thioredoxin 1